MCVRHNTHIAGVVYFILQPNENFTSIRFHICHNPFDNDLVLAYYPLIGRIVSVNDVSEFEVLIVQRNEAGDEKEDDGQGWQTE